jgi:hypothetical protein
MIVSADVFWLRRLLWKRDIFLSVFLYCWMYPPFMIYRYAAAIVWDVS